MPQSSKDSRGGKTQASRKTKSRPASAAEEKKSARSAKSPTGPMNKGEKKTTP